MIFETARLIVRFMSKDDLLPLHEMQADPEVMKYTGTSAQTLKENEEDINRVISCYKQENNDFWVWAIERKTDKAFVGTCAIVKTEEGQFKHREDELGFRLLRSEWSKGYGKEILPALIHYAFQDMMKTELVAEVDQRNTASIKILERFMHFEKSYFNEKDQCTDNLYRIVKS